MTTTGGAGDLETVVARAICVERFKDRKLAGEPEDANVDEVRHLAKAAIWAMTDLRTIEDAGDVPVRAVAYNRADGSIVSRFDEGNGVVLGRRPSISVEQRVSPRTVHSVVASSGRAVCIT